MKIFVSIFYYATYNLIAKKTFLIGIRGLFWRLVAKEICFLCWSGMSNSILSTSNEDLDEIERHASRTSDLLSKKRRVRIEERPPTIFETNEEQSWDDEDDEVQDEEEYEVWLKRERCIRSAKFRFFDPNFQGFRVNNMKIQKL